MKIFRIFLWFIFLVLIKKNISAQSDTAQLYQIYQSFSDPGKAEWTAFQNNRYYFNYTALKQKYHIKELNCKSCESFYANIYLEIDATGNVSNVSCLRVNYCGTDSKDKLLKSDFENSVKNQRFKSITGKKFTIRFGHVLKC